MATPKLKEGEKYFTVILSPELTKAVQAAAELDRRSDAEIIRRALTAWFQTEDYKALVASGTAQRHARTIMAETLVPPDDPPRKDKPRK
jgi:predicted transcriptional regulator